MKRILITLYVLASVVLTAVAQARFTSNTEMYSFGQIEWKHPVTVQYTITNTGDQPLVLTEVEPDCACSVAQWTKTPIAPGAKGTVNVTFDAKALGHFQKSVAIYSNAQPNLVYLKFNGEVVQEIKDFTKTHPYLIGQRDSKTETRLPDLTKEVEADKWIRTSPAAFCNTHNKQVLSQVLNNYDQETTDFYRWRVCYSQQELSELIHKRSGIEFGKIIDLIPVERGTSGRLVRLKIVGTLRTLIIGKELEIRRTLSSSHLYSSAFVVDKEYKEDEKEIPSRFILTGSGWGHGVGLCQIGAAVMGEQGYKYKEILSHYYPGSAIEQQYK